MRSADRGFSTMDGDRTTDAIARLGLTILKQVLNVLNNEINCHCNQHSIHNK